MITQWRLKDVLHYDPETGRFRWLVTNSVRAIAGSPAGSVANRGHVSVRIDGRAYQAHRLAWLYMTGVWPTHMVGHADSDVKNNRWVNLHVRTKRGRRPRAA
ncbi:HNH endonuclease [Ferirhizobium litorale]|uniref:HNH endonuclease n=1 Tax=Ferirhizobium litorale TaxID=2927786 RepID=UPI0035304EC8